MAGLKCKFADLAGPESGINCGTFYKLPKEKYCVSLRECNRDVAKHLISLNVRQNDVRSESELILLRCDIDNKERERTFDQHCYMPQSSLSSRGLLASTKTMLSPFAHGEGEGTQRCKDCMEQRHGL